jgi:hypothetical protein
MDYTDFTDEIRYSHREAQRDTEDEFTLFFSVISVSLWQIHRHEMGNCPYGIKGMIWQDGSSKSLIASTDR